MITITTRLCQIDLHCLEINILRRLSFEAETLVSNRHHRQPRNVSAYEVRFEV
jgi:hypothetical protein